MLAVAVPLPGVMVAVVTVMVTVWFDPTGFVAVAGVIAILASTHALLAGPLLPAVPLVVRVTEPLPVSGMSDVADTTVVPVAFDVMTTVQLALAPPPA